MRPENGNTAEVEFYTPVEFKALLDAADGPMRALIAIGGLAGLRTAELLRLTWEDTRRVENHIEITAGKAKTRQRRLVEIVPALAQWLASFQEFTGPICTLHEITWQQHFCKLCEMAKVEVKGSLVAVTRKPNGLRHAFCMYQSGSARQRKCHRPASWQLARDAARELQGAGHQKRSRSLVRCRPHPARQRRPAGCGRRARQPILTHNMKSNIAHRTLAVATIEGRIHLVRGHKAMLDRDLAKIYGVSTKALNQAVKRNRQRFPDEFVFRLTADNVAAFGPQTATVIPRGRPVQIVTGSQTP